MSEKNNPSPDTLSGSWMCGAVRYRISEAPIASALCHCNRCRPQSGSAFSTVVIISADDGPAESASEPTDVRQQALALSIIRVNARSCDLNRSSRQTFIDRSHVWEALHVDHETCEQRGLIVLSPGESQRQRHVQIDHGHNDNTSGTPPTCRSKDPSHTQAGRNEA